MSDHAKYWWEYEGIGILIHCWWKQKMEQLCWKTIWQSFKDLNMTIIQSSHFTFSYLHKAIKDLCMYICSTFICSSLICNSQNRKQVLFILKAGGEGDDRGWDGWMASPTQWTWVWVSSGSWCWTGKPGVLQCMGLQRVKHDWATELNWLNWTHPLQLPQGRWDVCSVEFPLESNPTGSHFLPMLLNPIWTSSIQESPDLQIFNFSSCSFRPSPGRPH